MASINQSDNSYIHEEYRFAISPQFTQFLKTPPCNTKPQFVFGSGTFYSGGGASSSYSGSGTNTNVTVYAPFCLAGASSGGFN
jgi:hypothetical protein